LVDELEELVVEFVAEVELVAEASFPLSLSVRLPRNCGVTSETKFAAAVTPVKRIDFPTMPGITLAVRIAVRAMAAGVFAGFRISRITAETSMTTAKAPPIQRPLFAGRFGRLGTSPGFAGTGFGSIAGTGAELMPSSLLKL
jgi:hypothetical protein